jgi:hypothetical protein
MKVKKLSKTEESLKLLEGIYKRLLGKNFCYQIDCMCEETTSRLHATTTSEDSPPPRRTQKKHSMGLEVDLFFLQVLYNRMEMAEVFWLRIKYPVAMAISAAYLLREMAKCEGLLPDARMLMLENAILFEKKAVGVMRIAQKTNQQHATLILDLGMRMWMETRLLDLAVQSDCRIFVRECCREAIDERLYGDIDPYQNSNLSSFGSRRAFWWILFNVFPLCGVWAAMAPQNSSNVFFLFCLGQNAYSTHVSYFAIMTCYNAP